MGERQKKGIITSVVGLICNLLLAASKIVAGIIFGSIAVTADGINNAADSASSIVNLVSFKMSGKPADKEHPFGHARIEYVATLFIAILIFVVAFELVKSSIEKLISGFTETASIIVFVVLAGSILVKTFMGIFYLVMEKKLNASSLKAAAIDSFSDVAVTVAVLISSLIHYLTDYSVDGYFGIGLALVIALSGVGILKDVINPLLGEPPSNQIVEKISKVIYECEGVLGLHDLVVHSYGPNKLFASVHIEVNGTVDTNSTHQMADKIEDDIKALGIDLVVHIDPCCENDNVSKN